MQNEKASRGIEPKMKDCFYSAIDAGNRVIVDFFVLRGGLLDIELNIISPMHEVMYTGLHFEQSKYEFTPTQSGVYQVCFNNEMARWTAKVVTFEVLVGDEINKPVAGVPDQNSKNTLTPLEESIRTISNSLDQVEEDQKYLRVREQKHRDTAESTNNRVLWYSILESMVLIGISLGQVYALRKFFEVKRTV